MTLISLLSYAGVDNLTKEIMIEDDLVVSVSQDIYRRFPVVKGSSPKVSTYGRNQTLLVFRGKGTTQDGKSLTEYVRVVVNDSGKITKLTTSRG
jgi:hypothetical protein